MQLFKGLSIHKYKSNAKDKTEEPINKNLDHETDFISSEMERILFCRSGCAYSKSWIMMFLVVFPGPFPLNFVASVEERLL